MADYVSDYSESSDQPLGGSVATFMNWVGAGLSLALLGGMATWGYQLMVRDVTGVPVVRAIEGPMRIAPEDPGGAAAEYQGLAVNEIAAVGTASDAADRVVLAPATQGLTEEDRPMAALLPDAPDTPLPAAEPKVSATDLAVAAALGEAGMVTLASATADDVPVIAASLSSPGEAVDDGGLNRSLRPAARPERRVASTAPATALPAAGSVDADLSAIPAGARLVQLGAFPTPEEAREEWERVAARFGDFMDGKQRVVQQAEAGGKTFYRLRVLGFEDLSDSRRFCAALVAGETNCIPVAWR